MEWKAIETAPYNEWILTTSRGNVLMTMLQSDKWKDDSGRLYNYFPTHWMPLPEPPKE